MSDTPPLPEAHEKVLDTALEEGRRLYGPLPLERDEFARCVLQLIDKRLKRAGMTPTDERVTRTLARTHLSDLFLTIACERDVAGAWKMFADRFGPRLWERAVRAGASKADAAALARDLPGELCTPPAGGETRTRLGTYDGTGSLIAWLSVIVTRRVIDQHRERNPSSLDDDSTSGSPWVVEMPDASSSARDPAAIAVDEETRSQCRAAMARAWNELTAQERVAMLAKYRDRLAQREIARLLGVGDPRVSRVLDRATEKIREEIARAFGTSDPTQFWAAMRSAVESQLANPQAEPDYPGEESSHG